MPPHWRQVFDAAGINSATDLADRMGVAVTTITRLIHGEGTSLAVASEAAKWLGITTADVWALSKRPGPFYEPFILPDSAAQLSRSQRRAVLAVIRTMLNPDASV